MGLDAHVLCTCFRDGRTKPHPIPALLAYDEVDGPILDTNKNPTLAQWLEHDSWRVSACEHPNGELVAIRLGNMSRIAAVRSDIESIERTSRDRFPIVLEKVVYDGIHSSDHIPVSEVPQLQNEINMLRSYIRDEYLSDFVDSMAKLCDASLRTRNPIVF